MCVRPLSLCLTFIHLRISKFLYVCGFKLMVYHTSARIGTNNKLVRINSEILGKVVLKYGRRPLV